MLSPVATQLPAHDFDCFSCASALYLMPELMEMMGCLSGIIGMHFAWTLELKGVITVSLVMIGMHIAWMPELRGVISVLSLVLDTPTALMVGLPSMT
jgi:hypothetical protein